MRFQSKKISSLIYFRDPSLRRPLLMTPDPAEVDGGGGPLLARDIAFRLCALRETFEEAGILLHTKLASSEQSSGAKIPEKDLIKWRPLVHKGS